MAIPIAPPFEGYFYIPAKAGAWSYSKVYPGTGQVVLQLGARPPNPTGVLSTGVSLTDYVQVGIPGPYVFTAAVDVGPLTLLPRGHVVEADIVMELEGTGGYDREVFRPPTPNGFIGARLGIVTLCFSADLEAGVPYRLRAACGLKMLYSGTPNPLPYAEIIATYRTVSMTRERYEAPEAETPFVDWTGANYHELKDEEIGAYDGIVAKK